MSDHQRAEDCCTIRGTLDLFEEDPATILTVQLVAMTQHVSQDTARRLLRNMAAAGVLEHPAREADILGSKQKVPCIGWILTENARRGEIPDAEDLVRRMP
ncbi:hypothetical protein M0R72_17830 [Candidatus Pacearchaeota archaeon]|jgi:hypothetical protein|nr:hypothetical protein [Candidatus Pacearchaeota archaeon]